MIASNRRTRTLVGTAGGLAVAVAVLTAGPAPSAPKPKEVPGAYDPFDGKFALDWKVVRPDASHVSFKAVPGCLVITTQRGSIHGKESEDPVSEGTRAKNIHLIDNPLAKEDWVATTCVVGFAPETTYQQAGLIVYEDDDNYLKWSYEYNWQAGRGQGFILVAETAGVTAHTRPERDGSGLKAAWLRLTKRGDKYTIDWSEDGKEWTAGGEKAWAGSPKRVGLIAKNGGSTEAPEIDAAFDFFELRPAPAAGK